MLLAMHSLCFDNFDWLAKSESCVLYIERPNVCLFMLVLARFEEMQDQNLPRSTLCLSIVFHNLTSSLGQRKKGLTKEKQGDLISAHK